MKINKVFTKLISKLFGAKEPKPEIKQLPSGDEVEKKSQNKSSIRFKKASHYMGRMHYDGMSYNGDSFNTHQMRKGKSNRNTMKKRLKIKHRRAA